MEGVLYFLFVALWFYIMMRFGCGAHMMHGHHGSEHSANHVDPVCGMKVPMEQGYGKMYQNTLFRFCSRNCLDKFEQDPTKFMDFQTDDK